MLTVRTPASSANLGSGFDCLGLSLPLYTTLRLSPAPSTAVIPVGEVLQGTPTDESNYVYRAMTLLAQAAGRSLPTLRLEIESEIPLARGLGSSAAALIAGMVAANEVLGRPLSAPALLDLASQEEGHPDNVAPALMGGFVAAGFDGQSAQVARFEPPAQLGATILIPDFELKTADARAALPEMYSRADAVHAASHAALTVAALASGRLELLRSAMQDRLHQPYRAPLVPGLDEILEQAPAHGALGAALSGAGPSVLCFHERGSSTEPLHRFLQDVLARQGLSGGVLDLPLDTKGTIITGTLQGT